MDAHPSGWHMEIIMTAQEYIDSGLVLDYCLDIMTDTDRASFELAMRQYPELRREVQIVQQGMDRYASANPAIPALNMKNKIWATLENLVLEEKMDLAHLPLINKYSNCGIWMEAMRPLLPPVGKKPFFAHVLTGTPEVTQVLIMSFIDIPDEVHGDLRESFIILEGECECTIGDQTVRVRAGEFVEIPLHAHHDVRVISDYVIGVMQRLAA